ncbi:hypothetical protein [Maribacter sp.]|uniref:hypothetical protein n=1 Tax=Maribacter sp. TaxID=1897614 RepID=UPI0025C6F3FF|nr:hypothetical protein [Maribacter sp.]
MKKALLFMTLAATISFTSCSKDDDDKKCNSCEVLGIKIEGCDNGDGTVTVKTLGQSTTYTEEDLDGVTPEAFVKNICAGTSGF